MRRQGKTPPAQIAPKPAWRQRRTSRRIRAPNPKPNPKPNRNPNPNPRRHQPDGQEHGRAAPGVESRPAARALCVAPKASRRREARRPISSPSRRAAPIFAAIMLPARGFGCDRGPAAAAPSKRRPQTVSRKAPPQAPSWGLSRNARRRQSGKRRSGEWGRERPARPGKAQARLQMRKKAKGFELRGARRPGEHGQNKRGGPNSGRLFCLTFEGEERTRNKPGPLGARRTLPIASRSAVGRTAFCPRRPARADPAPPPNRRPLSRLINPSRAFRRASWRRAIQRRRIDPPLRRERSRDRKRIGRADS